MLAKPGNQPAALGGEFEVAPSTAKFMSPTDDKRRCSGLVRFQMRRIVGRRSSNFLGLVVDGAMVSVVNLFPSGEKTECRTAISCPGNTRVKSHGAHRH